MLKPISEKATYVNILGSDGTLRKEVTETTPGAVKREWKSGDGKSSGVKWEHIYSELSGVITTVEFYSGDYGVNLIIGVTDGDEPEVRLSMSMSSSFGEDFALKLPALDIKKPVIIKPYSFVDDNGKPKKGVTVFQDGNKVQNFFYDAAKKETTHGCPVPQWKTDKKTGEKKQFTSEEWKLYFGIRRQFLIEYIEENHLLKNENAPAQISRDEAYANSGVQTSDEMGLSDLPF